jgi:hypothetical protein
MDPTETVETVIDAKFEFDLAGRVRNLGLPTSAANSLIPLFEAVSNAVHAIESRWQAKATTLGKIVITVIRRDDDEDGGIVGFEVTDNGIGLAEENWTSFRTSDSDFKVARGGKGVGRLAWLKAFSDCQIIACGGRSRSHYERTVTPSMITNSRESLPKMRSGPRCGCARLTPTMGFIARRSRRP